VKGGFANLRGVHSWNAQFVRDSDVVEEYEELASEIDRALAFMGARLFAHGVNVIFDATASRRAYREFARALIPELLEVSIECPLQVCMERDKKGTYRRGLEGTSSTVPGLQDAYEAPVSPALAIDTTVTSSDVAADQIVALIRAGRLR
jgi:adenylylsulfate kinase